MSMWQVKLPRFEGPLDLLLFLVTRKEYDILDLPMAEITESYLEALDNIGVDNLEDAGEYLLMAATLLSIKTRMMLPHTELHEELDIDDPRRELVNRLQIYARIKDAAADLAELELNMLDRKPLTHEAVPPESRPAGLELLMPLSVYDLARTMEEILARRETRVFHDVKLLKVTVEQRIEWVISQLTRETHFGLIEKLREVPERIVWVTTFLALLDLARQNKVKLEQNSPFDEIYVFRPEAIDSQAA
ncbi:MAG: segregation/condensation protein A [Calditrichaeota bacterium]|nr:segregation/condensation protein A [Calditrichota bacterium]MCB9366405.1 segregation/condensation protein A [Calditrichota bacterium]